MAAPSSWRNAVEDDRRQVPIQVFPGRRTGAGAQAIDAVQSKHRGNRPYLRYYFTGKKTRPSRSARPISLSASTPASRMPGSTTARGNELYDEFLKDTGIVGKPGGGTGDPDGGWFRNEIKTLDDLKGIKMRIAGVAGEVMSPLASAAAAYRAAISIRRWNAARSMPPNGSAPMTTSASASTDCSVLLLPGLLEAG